MLTIHKKDGTSQIVKVSPEFFHSVTLGNGKHKRVITFRDKALDVAHHLSTTLTAKNLYSGHILTQGDVELVNVGFPVEKQAPPQKDWGRVIIKSAKRDFKKFLEENYSFELAHGQSLNKVWLKTTQKFNIASSTTQLL